MVRKVALLGRDWCPHKGDRREPLAPSTRGGCRERTALRLQPGDGSHRDRTEPAGARSWDFQPPDGEG